MSELEITLVLLGVSSITLSFLFNHESKIHWFILKTIGVAASTITIIGILQGLIVREKDVKHSNACLIQTGLGIAAFLVLYYGLGVIEL